MCYGMPRHGGTLLLLLPFDFELPHGFDENKCIIFEEKVSGHAEMVTTDDKVDVSVAKSRKKETAMLVFEVNLSFS